MSADRIEKLIRLKAPVVRVWKALADSREFGSWFGMRLDGPFVAGERLRGTIAPTTVDAEVAKLQAPHVDKVVELQVVTLDRERCFAFRWHPFAIDASVDYSKEPTTLVTFTLRAVGSETELVLVESGFDALPAARRADAFRANDGGWASQMSLITTYLASHAA